MPELLVPCGLSIRQLFEDNEFDIAGLAELPDEVEVLNSCLIQLYGWTTAGRQPITDEDLARVLFVLIKVAQQVSAAF